MTKTPTLADVARRAGVSTATVSRCLNAPERVQRETRERIEAAVAEIGYSPNFGARALAAKRTDTIGAIVPTLENSVFARGLQAFQTGLVAQGMTLLLASSAYRPDLEAAQIRTLVARGADGLLLIGHERDPALYDFLALHRVPVLVAWVYDPSEPRPSVGFDNKAAMAEMTAAVLAQGHRRLATISGHTRFNDRTRDRVAGVRAAMAAQGLDPATLTVIETPYGIETGARAMADLMTAPHPPTAVICGNDVLALGALRQARAMGLRVPEDVSITGFDDTELSTVADPPLATVSIPHGEMGARAAIMLTEMVRTGAQPDSVALPCVLRLRGSLGPVPRAA
ncbi:LacI family DNA-binding transcriptional regulator [Jannaschia seohaensis]|uniref:LacI family transcriptional regulator n=1 Tax=Jannaschia seohaensis TaxID=475081 RepID=A0A2Y9APX8_9RHOB|nr:LacI family DNA-binding transcriptional regulator [Jannaschia seohaensis]PWJ18019.1 LacI family transcriptional regulator [Jannaschia seohaensis]SSA46541.1 LacI family transcriptional regulator [Jannaschia seohaensis]